MGDQIAQHPMDRATAVELREDRLDHPARLLIGILDHRARQVTHIAHRQKRSQLAATGLRPFAFEQTLLEDVQLGFRHGAFQSQQQSIVVGLRIIHSVGIGDQGREQRADFQQLIPVARTPGQARDLQTQHDPNVIKAHFGHQTLKSGTPLGARSRASEIFIDEQDLLA